MKKLSELEVEKLYKFTREHYVEYYDVQMELVDHLASGIEERWGKDPEFSFDKALQQEFKKFGVYGFSSVVEKRQQTMEKRYFKLILKESMAILLKPLVLLSFVFLFLLSFFMLALDHGLDYIFYMIIAYFLILITTFSIRSYAIKKKKKKNKTRIFLLEAVILNSGSYFSFFWLPIYIIHFSIHSGRVDNLYLQIPLAAFFSLLVLTSFVSFYVLPKKRDEILKKVYPEMKYY